MNGLARALAAVMIGACWLNVARADAIETFYAGKTIQVMIGYGVGGADDTWARLVAQFLPAHLPGHPNAVPVNVPGAGSLLLANQIYNVQPKDGTVIGLINRGVPFEALLGGGSVRFDATKFNYLGSPDTDTLVCEARVDAPVQNLQDLKTRELIVGSTGSGADSQVYPEFLNNLLGLKFKIVQGYPGSADILLALERNEVQSICVSNDTIQRNAYFRSGKSHLLFQAALAPDPRIPDAPLVTDLATTDDQRAALKLVLQRTEIGRPFVVAPGVPAERVSALRQAFAAVMSDPAFIEGAKTSKLAARPVSGETIARVISAAYATSPEVVAVAKKAFGR